MRAPPVIVRVVAQYKVLATYTCMKCGRVETGTTKRDECDVGDVDDLAAAVKRIDLRRSHPFGWLSSSEGYKCTDCI